MGRKIDGSYDSLIQGISQQAPSERLDGQHTLQENISNDPERGLVRRPGTEWVTDMETGAVYYTDFELDNELYVLAIHPHTMFAYTRSGKKYPVTGSVPDMEYVVYSENLRAVTVNDTVYITNPDVITKMTTEKTQGFERDAGIVHLLGGAYGRTFVISITWNGITQIVKTSTPDGSSPSHSSSVATTTIANNLAAALRANATIYARFNIDLISDVLFITSRDTIKYDDFTITVEDGTGGTHIIAFTDRVGDVGKLSRFAPHNYVVRVVGTEGTADDDWFLRFDADNKESGAGVWVETTEPGIEYRIDAESMPHIIRMNEAGNGFTVSAGEWKERRVGNETTNPIPSFIGHGIEDITLFQSRLVFLAGANVIMSRSTEFFDFWKNSATALADDDVIDISSATTRSAPVMRKAVPHNRDLVIFAESAQFIVFGRNAITPQNTSLVLTTTFETNTKALPVSAGKNVLYSTDFGDFSGIKEFYVESGADINASRPITNHCSKYIRGSATRLAATSNFDMLLVQTDKTQNELYLYQWLWIGDQKMQSAWSKWIFPDPVKYFTFFRDELFIVLSPDINSRISLLRMDLDSPDNVSGFHIHLDYKKNTLHGDKPDSEGVYWSTQWGTTTKSLLNAGKTILSVQADGCPQPGMLAPIDKEEELSNGHIKRTFAYSMNGGSIITGVPFESKVIFTPPVLRESEEDKAITIGRLSVHHFVLHLIDTGLITCTRLSKVDGNRSMEFNGRFTGLDSNSLDKEMISTYMAVMPFMGDVETTELMLSSDAHTPFRLTRMTYLADYFKQGTHV